MRSRTIFSFVTLRRFNQYSLCMRHPMDPGLGDPAHRGLLLSVQRLTSSRMFAAKRICRPSVHHHLPRSANFSSPRLGYGSTARTNNADTTSRRRLLGPSFVAGPTRRQTRSAGMPGVACAGSGEHCCSCRVGATRLRASPSFRPAGGDAMCSSNKALRLQGPILKLRPARITPTSSPSYLKYSIRPIVA